MFLGSDAGISAGDPWCFGLVGGFGVETLDSSASFIATRSPRSALLRVFFLGGFSY